jgi:PleD family two-component response regulator
MTISDRRRARTARSTLATATTLPALHLRLNFSSCWLPRAQSALAQCNSRSLARADLGGVVVEERPDILLIEDSPSQALRIQLLLQRAGYTVQIASDGATGWRQAYALTPRLILLGVDLPVFDGFQLLARLKRAAATAQIPVVMLTDRDHIGSVERAIALGANDCLFKDNAPYQLIAAVGQLVPLASPHDL